MYLNTKKLSMSTMTRTFFDHKPDIKEPSGKFLIHEAVLSQKFYCKLTPKNHTKDEKKQPLEKSYEDEKEKAYEIGLSFVKKSNHFIGRGPAYPSDRGLHKHP